MSSYKIHAALVICALALGGCGFTPVYATPDAGSRPAMQQQLENVEIGLIADREGQYLRNALLDQMGSTTASSTGQRYFLRIHNLKHEDSGFGLRKDASYTRGDITTTATMDLIDTHTNQVILTRALRARAGYNRMDNLYGASVSQEDTINRLLDEMAERAVTELTLHFNRAKN